MKLFYIFIAFLTVLCSTFVRAQQDYQVTHYMYDRVSYNPAYAGLSGRICATLIARKQWHNFDRSPTTQSLSISSPVTMLKGGVSFTFVNDKLGFEKNQDVRLGYSYYLPRIKGGDLSIGLALNLSRRAIDAEWVTPDGQPASTDNLINTGGVANSNKSNLSAMGVDLNAGVFYKKQKQWYAGASVTNILGREVLGVKKQMHLWLTGGYNYDYSVDIRVRSNFLMKSDLKKHQFDFNVNVLYLNRFWGGLTFRSVLDVVPMFGYIHPLGPNFLRIGYSYGLTLSKIRSYNSGSHELMMKYCFSITPPVYIQKHRNPRMM